MASFAGSLTRATPLRDSDGRVIRWFGSITNVDEQRRQAAELREALQLRDTFLSVASHELKTPLTPMAMRLDALAKATEAEPDSPFVHQVRSYSESARRQIRKLTALVNDLLDVSRIAAGRFRMELEQVDLVALVREVVPRFELEAEKAGSKLTFEAPGTLLTRTAKLRVEQVVMNLLDNAITAVSFLVASGALTLQSLPRPQKVMRGSVVLALAPALTGLLVVLGYLFGKPLLYDEGTVIPLALMTGLGFLFLGVALVLTGGQTHWPVRLFVGTSVRARLLRAFLPLTVGLVLVVGWLAILIASTPNRNPALWAVVLAGASVLAVSVIVSDVARSIGAIIEKVEAERIQAEEHRTRAEVREEMGARVAPS